MGWTKHYFLLLFLILLIAQFTYAENLNCEYTKLEEYYVPERILVYEGSDVKRGEDLIFSDFNEGKVASFIIKNPNDFRVMVILNYSIEGTGAKDLQYGKWINADDTIQIRDICRENEVFGTCSINEDSLIYHIDKPQIMYPEEIEIEKTRTVCDGKNNGSMCTNDNECGSRKCNFAGFCGKFTHCPEGTTNCQNIKCLVPSSKDLGESYLCDWECKTNYGKEGRCERTTETVLKERVKFWSIVALIFGIATLLLVISFHREIWKKITNMVKDKAEKEAEEIRENAKREAESIIRDSEQRLKQNVEEIKEKQKIKEEIEKAMAKLGDSEEIRDKLAKVNEDIKTLTTQKDYEIRRYLDTLEKKEGHKFILDGGYVRYAKSLFNPNEKGGFYHTWVWKKRYKKVRKGYHIHHKDKNKLNNNIENLEEVEGDDHLNRHKSGFY